MESIVWTKMSVKIVYPPGGIIASNTSIFLAGTIDMGNSVDWQQQAIETIQSFNINSDITIYNPRRKDWNSSWKQDINDPQFSEQVNWELDALESANFVIVYFKKDSLSPVSMLELGLFVHKKNILVCCEEGFWRKGNIDIVCRRNGIKVYTELPDMLCGISAMLTEKNN